MGEEPNQFEAAFKYTRSGLRFATPEMSELVSTLVPVLAQLCCELEHLPAARLYDEEAVIKEPGCVPTNPHIDIVNWAHSGQRGMTAWFALDDATVENGCLYFVNGSHKMVSERRKKEGRYAMTGTGDLGDPRGLSAVFEVYPEGKALSVTHAVIPAGSVSLHSGHTIHGAGPNVTRGFRRAFVISFMPEDAAFNGKQDALIESQQLTFGQTLANNQLWPCHQNTHTTLSLRALPTE